ncbi:MAG TPA: NAD-dependent epimerase/dehydratase family protein [Acidimicrobiales bacterium]|nr:NAD-dependent epimerase/dehydratase family protein [Acidimicrobiales bacterium]
MRALVLGGNRYIGMQLLYELADQGHEVTVMNSHLADMPEGTRRLHGDRRVPGVLEEVLGPHRDEFDVVYDNTSYVVADVEPLVALFQGRVSHYVFTSSAAVYRRSFVQPVTESSRTHDPGDDDPRKAYGVGKVRCERYLFGLQASDGFPATSLRVTHTIGPRSPLASREPSFFARLEQGRPILIPGDGFPFVHLVDVADVARCMVAVASSEAAAGNAYNVAGPEITSVAGCMHLMGRAAGASPRIVNVPMAVARRTNPPLVHWGEAIMGGTILSIDRAATDLGWRPQIGLEAAYRRSYDWWATAGRDRYEYDFARDDALLAELG